MTEKQQIQQNAPPYETATPVPHSHDQQHKAAVSASAPQPMQQVGGAPHQGPYQQQIPSMQDQNMLAMNQGAMYQQQMMAQCAQGNHSYDTKVSLNFY